MQELILLNELLYLAYAINILTIVTQCIMHAFCVRMIEKNARIISYLFVLWETR